MSKCPIYRKLGIQHRKPVFKDIFMDIPGYENVLGSQKMPEEAYHNIEPAYSNFKE